ncbi:MAG: EthD domain-containing protein, partial [Gammaproteobacteria bacterium]
MKPGIRVVEAQRLADRQRSQDGEADDRISPSERCETISMVKAVSFFKRRAGMDVEEFQAYWRTRHPEVVTKLSGVRRYVQLHTRLGGYRDGEPVYD